jgi:hypothetical protein
MAVSLDLLDHAGQRGWLGLRRRWSLRSLDSRAELAERTGTEAARRAPG